MKLIIMQNISSGKRTDISGMNGNKGAREITVYGGEYAYQYHDRDYYSFNEVLPGFVNHYATLSQEEDRSEIIAYFLIDLNYEHENLVKKAVADKCLYAKCLLLFKLYQEKLGFSEPLKVFLKKTQEIPNQEK